jgi:acyl carrier protein
VNPSIVATLKPIIASQLCIALDDVRDDASFVEDLGADSLSLVELALAVEHAFNLVIPDAEAAKLRTVRDTIEYLGTRVR